MGWDCTIGMPQFASPYPNVVCVILQCFHVLKNRTAQCIKPFTLVHEQVIMKSLRNIPASQTVAGGGEIAQTAQVPMQITTGRMEQLHNCTMFRATPTGDRSHR